MGVINVSDISSLNFRDDWKLDFQQNVDYVSKFLPSDIITIQYVSLDTSVKAYLENHTTGIITELSPTKIEEGSGYGRYNLEISNTSISEDTCFTLFFASSKEGTRILSSDFDVCMELPSTVLLKYTNRRNENGVIFSPVSHFYFRIDGMFLPQENEFENETKSFRDQRFVSKVLSSHTYETKTLTLGGNFGVPNWVARKINLIFSLSAVWIDDMCMARSDGSKVEITLLHNDYPLYIYKIVLEDSEPILYSDTEDVSLARSVDEKKKIIRRASDDIIRTYSELAAGNALMIRELELIAEISNDYTIEIDDNSSDSTRKVPLSKVIELFAKRFLSKDREDTASDVITFEKGLVSKDVVQSDNFSSKNFTSGPLGSGHRIKDGDAEFQNLTVRGQFSVFEYLIQQVKAIGGKFCVSPASMRIGQVEETEDGYKCFFNTDGGTIMNPFVVGDQAFHQVFDGSNMKRYWRLVTEVGADYFVLSKTDCEANSGIPEADEEIVLLGNRTDRNRQSAIMISAYDNNSPYIAFYNWINSYSFEGKEPMRTGNLNGIVDEDFGQLTGFGLYCQNVYMKGVFRLMSGKTVEQSIGEVQSNIDNLQIGTKNLISWKMMLEWNKKNKDIAVYGKDEDGVYLTWDLSLMMSHGIAIDSLNRPYVDIFDNKIKYKTNTQYVISIESKSERRAGDIFFYYTDGSRTGGELSVNFGRINLVSTLGKTVEKIVFYVRAINNPRIYNISLTEGNKPLQGFPVATDDLPNNINLADGTKEVVVGPDANNWTYTKLLVPKIKPNIAYYITFNAENLAGEASEYRAILYKKDISGDLSTAADTSNGGIILTHNDFDEQEGYLLLYAGVWGSTAGNGVKYTDIMLVEGRFPATAYSPSVNEQEQKIETLTTSVTNIQADTNGIRQTVTETVARVDAAVATETIIDLRNPKYDQSKYYPVTFNLTGHLNTVPTRIELDSPLDANWGQPSWATHSNGTKSFSLLCMWTTNGNGWGSIKVKRVIEAYAYEWANDSPAGSIGQMGHSSNEYIYLRGGGKYRFRCTNKVVPVLHESSFTVSNETINILTSVDKPVLDLELASSEILQLKDQITLKVEKGDIINQINVSTEGIRIKGSRIELDGTTIFKKGIETIQIFGDGDDVLKLGNGTFKVDKYGKATMSGAVLKEANVSGTIYARAGQFGALCAVENYITVLDTTKKIIFGLDEDWVATGVSMTRNKVTVNLPTKQVDDDYAIIASHKGKGIKITSGEPIYNYYSSSASLLIEGLRNKTAMLVQGRSEFRLGVTRIYDGLALNLIRVAGNYTLDSGDGNCVIVYNGSTSGTITFPSNCDNGRMFWIITANAKPNIKLPTGDSISNTSGLSVSAKWHVYIYDKANKTWMYSYMNI